MASSTSRLSITRGRTLFLHPVCKPNSSAVDWWIDSDHTGLARGQVHPDQAASLNSFICIMRSFHERRMLRRSVIVLRPDDIFIDPHSKAFIQQASLIGLILPVCLYSPKLVGSLPCHILFVAGTRLKHLLPIRYGLSLTPRRRQHLFSSRLRAFCHVLRAFVPRPLVLGGMFLEGRRVTFHIDRFLARLDTPPKDDQRHSPRLPPPEPLLVGPALWRLAGSRRWVVGATMALAVLVSMGMMVQSMELRLDQMVEQRGRVAAEGMLGPTETESLAQRLADSDHWLFHHFLAWRGGSEVYSGLLRIVIIAKRHHRQNHLHYVIASHMDRLETMVFDGGSERDFPQHMQVVASQVEVLQTAINDYHASGSSDRKSSLFLAESWPQRESDLADDLTLGYPVSADQLRRISTQLAERIGLWFKNQIAHTPLVGHIDGLTKGLPLTFPSNLDDELGQWRGLLSHLRALQASYGVSGHLDPLHIDRYPLLAKALAAIGQHPIVAVPLIPLLDQRLQSIRHDYWQNLRDARHPVIGQLVEVDTSAMRWRLAVEASQTLDFLQSFLRSPLAMVPFNDGQRRFDEWIKTSQKFSWDHAVLYKISDDRDALKRFFSDPSAVGKGIHSSLENLAERLFKGRLQAHIMLAIKPSTPSRSPVRTPAYYRSTVDQLDYLTKDSESSGMLIWLARRWAYDTLDDMRQTIVDSDVFWPDIQSLKPQDMIHSNWERRHQAVLDKWGEVAKPLLDFTARFGTIGEGLGDDFWHDIQKPTSLNPNQDKTPDGRGIYRDIIQAWAQADHPCIDQELPPNVTGYSFFAQRANRAWQYLRQACHDWRRSFPIKARYQALVDMFHHQVAGQYPFAPSTVSPDMSPNQLRHFFDNFRPLAQAVKVFLEHDTDQSHQDKQQFLRQVSQAEYFLSHIIGADEKGSATRPVLYLTVDPGDWTDSVARLSQATKNDLQPSLIMSIGDQMEVLDQGPKSITWRPGQAMTIRLDWGKSDDHVSADIEAQSKAVVVQRRGQWSLLRLLEDYGQPLSGAGKGGWVLRIPVESIAPRDGDQNLPFAHGLTLSLRLDIMTVDPDVLLVGNGEKLPSLIGLPPIPDFPRLEITPAKGVVSFRQDDRLIGQQASAVNGH